MDKRTTDIVAYITVIGLLLAVLIGAKDESKFHINQALVIWIFSLLSAIPCVGWIWSIFILVFWLMGLIAAINGEERQVPIIGGIRLIK